MKQTYRVKAGKSYWFEYHCWESDQSADAELWHHSHQRVRVIKRIQDGGGKDEDARCYNGDCACYKVVFADGFKADAMEDELLDSKRDFTRPDPPKRVLVKDGKNRKRD